MDITYLGHSSFKIVTKLATLVTDPFDASMVGLKFPKLEADIATLSHNHPDHNQIENLSGLHKTITNAGEYEIKGISIIGLQSFHDDKGGEERGNNVIYIYEAEGLRICHLGDLGHKLSDDLVTQIGTVDVLMVPVGGEYTLGPAEAAQVVGDIEPRIVIPMHYKMEGMTAEFDTLKPVEEFTKTIGLTPEVTQKLSLKADTLTDDIRLVILERK